MIPDERTVNVSQRISDRGEGDVRGNITAGVDILVDVGPSLYQDLRQIRQASKEAFGKWEGGGEDLGEFDSPLIQLLPDWLLAFVAKQTVKNPSKTLCTLSNVGKAPESMLRFAGKSASALYPVFVLPKQTDASLWRTSGSAVQGSLIDLGDVTSIVLEGRNPERHSVEHAEFVKLVIDECARWGLEPLHVL
ncbi:hypothetical protein [Segniliparus rugosus]|uniref:hypothetical protein n=1 Tax=Segniliparus rugosus TaxID=286804 RepID=UPI0012EBA3BC|nr:hypothetical protein [Segniliparus rugosus]